MLKFTISDAPDGPVGERPPPATNLTLTQEAGGYVLRWQGPADSSKILYYTIEIKKDGQGEKWRPLTDHRIDTEEASYMSKFGQVQFGQESFGYFTFGQLPIRQMLNRQLPIPH